MRINSVLRLLLGVVLLASCSEDTGLTDTTKEEVAKLSAMGVYEGEWQSGTRTREIGKTILTVKKDSMEFVLPEEWIVSGSGIFLGMGDIFTSDLFHGISLNPQFQGAVLQIHYTWQGVSENACYVEMDNGSFYNGNGDIFHFTPVYGMYSFGMTINDVPYRVDLILREKVTAMYDVNTQMWSIMIPPNRIAVVNLETGKTVFEYDFNTNSGSPMLVFNTTKKIY
jgi:hypothetical protein